MINKPPPLSTLWPFITTRFLPSVLVDDPPHIKSALFCRTMEIGWSYTQISYIRKPEQEQQALQIQCGIVDSRRQWQIINRNPTKPNTNRQKMHFRFFTCRPCLRQTCVCVSKSRSGTWRRNRKHLEMVVDNYDPKMRRKTTAIQLSTSSSNSFPASIIRRETARGKQQENTHKNKSHVFLLGWCVWLNFVNQISPKQSQFKYKNKQGQGNKAVKTNMDLWGGRLSVFHNQSRENWRCKRNTSSKYKSKRVASETKIKDSKTEPNSKMILVCGVVVFKVWNFPSNSAFVLWTC